MCFRLCRGEGRGGECIRHVLLWLLMQLCAHAPARLVAVIQVRSITEKQYMDRVNMYVGLLGVLGHGALAPCAGWVPSSVSLRCWLS